MDGGTRCAPGCDASVVVLRSGQEGPGRTKHWSPCNKTVSGVTDSGSWTQSPTTGDAASKSRTEHR
jgi:hypothetical protein